ncbi:MAG: deoxyribodipyrimidine photo-lyase [Phycisphaerae bacterium]|nr:deoxyribodipyrimidine photo-lyase [Phycisphaerae bacterium]
MSISPTIVWFRQDLRLDDNPALDEAVRRGGAVIPTYIWAPDAEGDWPPGAAGRWWLHQSLASLEKGLRGLGSRLVIRRGDPLDVLRDLVGQAGAEAVYWNRRYEPAADGHDERIKAGLSEGSGGTALDVRTFKSSLLFEPDEVCTKQWKPYQVYTPFRKACLALPSPPEPIEAPARLKRPRRWPESLALDDLEVEPQPDWAAGMREEWTPGGAGARERLDEFLREGVVGYATGRDRPDRIGTSRLSPHLHFGEISPRQVWHAVKHRVSSSRNRAVRQGAEVFLSQLIWREFAHHLLHHFPHTPAEPLRAKYAAFPWIDDESGLRAWQRGRTGYPIVDAGMRELWAIGWMHNRVRMIVASFLVKDLLIPWQQGVRWFWDTLVDADLANNTLGWQWTAGCGADAAPYFRVFNPVSQGQRFDPKGEYVARWVPELGKLPPKWIHRPWEAPPSVLAGAGVALGKTYPAPIIDHDEARRRALAALATLKG